MTYDAVIIGGGIVGVSTALRLLEQRPGSQVAVLEKEPALAQHQTGNNSGVIHAGLYYKPGSLKARTCRQGYSSLLEFCRREDIPHEVCGKVVVATSPDEYEQLEVLFRRGTENGLTGLQWLSAEQIREREPNCAGLRGILVPQTGIVDYGAVAARMADRIRELGGEIFLNSKVSNLLRQSRSVVVEGTAGTYEGAVVVNCAGLHADRLARLTRPDLPLRIIPFRGEYYVLKPAARTLVRHLIYPVPDPAFPFLGVHFTRMIGGGVECGPNAVFAFGREAYSRRSFNLRDTFEAFAWPGFRHIARRYWRKGMGEFVRSFSKTAFVTALQRLVPAIRGEDLEPGGAGIRAQACSRDGRLLDDFEILEDERVIHVCNAPSPAATASLAIGDRISRLAASRLN